ncbi:MFS transporter [Aspergillus arachidicola]|uniref:MFS transporter n=1 Tax=Aspergillus arachidicola TaxID=656916 RepID=A0A2G7GAK7_9EURO|nr:MFS transporter [Aspergillus arachidicola]
MAPTTTTTMTAQIDSPPLASSVSSVSSVERQTIKKTRLQQVVVIVQLVGVTLTASLINGLVTIALPTITKDLELPSSLAFWPSSVSSLATASTLLLAGSIADTIGPRWVELVGSFSSGALMIGQGLAQNGEGLVVMRALQGVGLAFHLASSVSIITQLLPQGRGRNFAFSCIGLSQPLGFSLGLVVGGVLVDTIGWRAGWYIAGGITLFFAVIAVWTIPKNKTVQDESLLHNVRTKIDWLGAFLASAFMALLCYLLAIVILCLAAIALPLFIISSHHRVKRNKVALIPNSLWRNTSFSSVCATVALSNAVLNSMELFASLFFQEVQYLSALQASIRILPSLIVGALLNLIIGLFVHKIRAVWIVTITSLLCAGSPLLMAVIQPSWPYWGNAFFAQILQPVSFDALFTVGLIVITDVFPDDTQALAGAVFNTSAQFGSALGLAVLQVISTVVTDQSGAAKERYALMDGYRASFWTMFGSMIVCTLVGFLGLRKAGRVGLKQD